MWSRNFFVSESGVTCYVLLIAPQSFRTSLFPLSNSLLFFRSLSFLHPTLTLYLNQSIFISIHLLVHFYLYLTQHFCFTLMTVTVLSPLQNATISI